MRPINQAVVELAQLEAHNMALHDDVDAWDAPSECHADVNKGSRREFKQFEEKWGITTQAVLNYFLKMTGNDRCWDSLVFRFWNRYSLYGRDNS